MKLTRERSQKLLQERGIWVTEACDRCGQLLGAVCWTRRGDPGEWCSAACKDGISAPESVATVRLSTAPRQPIGSRPAGRPRKHANNAGKCRAYRKRIKSGSATRNTPRELTENAQLPSAENGSRGGHVVRRTAAVVEAPIEKSQLRRNEWPHDGGSEALAL
jgi:hypothetical protein